MWQDLWAGLSAAPPWAQLAIVFVVLAFVVMVRFTVRQDGVPVRDGRLDAATRAAVIALFDTPATTGPVSVQEQRLQLFAAPWLDLTHAALGERLRRQAALASALERTAGWRGPRAGGAP